MKDLPKLYLGDSSSRVTKNHRRLFARRIRALSALIREIREYEPDAQYYLACDSLNLMVGDSHEGACGAPRYERIACSMSIEYADGGDW